MCRLEAFDTLEAEANPEVRGGLGFTGFQGCFV